MNRIIFSFVLVFFTLSLLAQPLRKVTYKVMIETAEEALANKDYYNAYEWYSKSYKEERNKDVSFIMATLQYKMRDYLRAEKSFQRIVDRDRNAEYLDALYYLGNCQKMNGKYPQAKDSFFQYIDVSENDELRQAAIFELNGIELAGKLEYVEDITVINAGKNVNSSYSESSPYMGSDGSLFFSSFNRRKLLVLDGKEEDDYHAKIYRSALDDEGKWGKSEALDKAINKAGFHIGNICMSEDGQQVFFTRAQVQSGDLTDSKIYMSQRVGTGWGAAEEVPNLNGDFISKQPMIGELFGNEVLFFVSNMDGGLGGFDIYYSTMGGSREFSQPVNLGDVINTTKDDETPFYQDGKLYFSSNGRFSMGGIDIYSSTWDGVKWSEATNMGPSYNSTYDDFYYSVDEEGINGFLVSNRPSESAKSIKNKTCCDDIYMVIKAVIEVDLQTLVYTEANEPLNGATVKLMEVIETEIGETEVRQGGSSNEFGFPLVLDRAYKVIVEREGYFPSEFEFNTVGISQSFSIKRNVTLKEKPKEPEYETIVINEAIRLNSIYYDFDDYKILPEAETDLTTLFDLLNEYPDMVIELSSHTDSQGEDAYNQTLSQRRAQAAKNWIVRKGVSARRIKAVGYGETKILNECANGVECTDEEHRLNRRTEFKIIEGPTSIQIKKEVLKGSQKIDQTPGSKQSMPSFSIPQEVKLTFSDNLVDFGSVKRGEKKEHTFTFTNEGDEDVVIDIVSSCECTTLEWPEGKTFKPGEKGKIKAVFDSTNKEESETVDIDVVLKNVDPATGYPILYILKYKFDLVL